ncbi:metallophosphoesterase [Paenibacillus sp. MMS20-IR301]|uniref:metallophosphoesterase n=1 Tax=Paenibacillus sp. MMS20-IR301 TaxID=2895946 RepID=UPI0028E24C55|nr:metallophosphoesterase [Paenibacillus sp. MMS20-IR301]WNS46680.1 metallophosphoesterase [Paenibacillus sp. MMS20-IR301]
MPHTPQKTNRLLAVSDIHGHAAGLEQLLDAAGYDPLTDRLMLLGDYIDEDPQSRMTLKLIRDLTLEGAVALPGNMETRLLKELKEAETMEAVLPEELRLEAALLEEWLEQLPPYAEADGYLFVHAGFRPGVPLNRQTLLDMTEIRQDFWAGALPTFIDNGIVFGHTPTFKLGGTAGRVWRQSGRIGIDTGAKHGFRLTLLDVHNAIAYSCIAEPSRQRYEDFRADALD